MNFIIALLRLVGAAFVLALLLAWLKDGNAEIARTLPWTLYPFGGGLVAARSILDWEGNQTSRYFALGAARIAAFFAIVATTHYGFPHSVTAVAIAFVAMLAVARYPLQT
ncbi:hypothetical protein [Rhizobium sp. AAP43]|uniref:hypothetical protein n=1 Tax=Rhizobium sp. AAP43 TaxID=1523420 RepID=UPI0006B9249C|nr:hypothetical protein [Rhizobium sp. AAP43]KPF46941.1 hypothetical protein IP76_03530 [Rhizobium sp. AAP43]